MTRTRLAVAAALLLVAPVAAADEPRGESMTVGGVKVDFLVPGGATPLDPKVLPQVEKDLGSVPGAKVSAQKGFARAGEHGDSVVVTCVTAPADNWTPELEPAVFDKIGEAMRVELAKRATWDRFAVSPPVADGKVQYAPLGGEGTREKAAAGHRAFVDGRVALGFYDDAGPKALVCVAVCEETTSPASRACPKLGASLRFSGALVDPPKPSAGARAVAAVARRPLAGAGLLVGLTLMAVGVVLLAKKPA